jgi:hypothetical protein
LLGSRATGLQPHVQPQKLFSEWDEHLWIGVGKTELLGFETREMLCDLTSGRSGRKETIHAADVRIVLILSTGLILDADGIPMAEQELTDGPLNLACTFFS